ALRPPARASPGPRTGGRARCDRGRAPVRRGPLLSRGAREARGRAGGGRRSRRRRSAPGRRRSRGGDRVSGENLQVAIKYAQRGFAVFPLVTRTKEPATAHGCKDATRDPAIITRWWWSRASRGVAIRTGQASRLIVLDIDPRHGGDESLADLEQKYGPLPSAPTVHTGSDGKHYYLAYPLENLAYPPGAGEISCRVGL